ncbi:MAG: thermonuclease family protein [Candidatus Magasanikbacteria bacterium]|nr:thermonuclease family protein [Candidatus Magasanikbacteria bacterium]
MKKIFLVVVLIISFFGYNFYFKYNHRVENKIISPVVNNFTTSTSETFLVTRVVDGDTIELENGQKVRYIGMDTPETVDPREEVQCFGKEASDKNKEMVEGKMVRMESDVTDKDKYGRLLRYVYVGDVFVNLELVKEGYAKIYTFPSDVKYQKLFLEAQQEAKENKLGLWGFCKKY